MFMVLDADGSRGHTNVWKNERLLCKLFDTCEPLAQDRTKHNSLSKYGDALIEAPKELRNSDAVYHCLCDGKAIKVSADIDPKGEKTLTIYVGIVM